MVHSAKCAFVVALGLLAACNAEPEKKLSLVEATIADIQDAVASGATTCEDVVSGYIRLSESTPLPSSTPMLLNEQGKWIAPYRT